MRLKINPNKTKLLVLKPRKKRCEPNLTIKFGASEIEPVPCAKIFGIHRLRTHMGETSVTDDPPLLRCFCRTVKTEKLSYETKKLLVEALVFPHIYYCFTLHSVGRMFCHPKVPHTESDKLCSSYCHGTGQVGACYPGAGGFGMGAFWGYVGEARCGPHSQASVARRAAGSGQTHPASLSCGTAMYPWNQWRPAGDAENQNRAREAAFSVQSCDRLEWQL